MHTNLASRSLFTIPTIVATSLLAGCALRELVIATALPAVDPPARVARLSYLAGAVSFSPAGTDDWSPAGLNRPMTTGDTLWTDSDARAELHVGTAAVRLSSRTATELLNLDDRTLQMKLSQGTLGLRIRSRDEEDTLEVDTPSAAISALRTGEYRVEVSLDGGETHLIVWSGQLDVAAPGQTFVVHAGQQARVYGADFVQYEVTVAPRRDAFDDFCSDRDRREERVGSLQYVSSSMIGWEDLDGYGAWRIHAGYGPIWAPRNVAPGWAPYRFGHWVWIEPWGWTWIDDAPWGFAPFHYGRWAYIDGHWCWIPGPMRIRPVYAPALVVFIGGGPGLHHYFRIGVGIGVAWFPLGPREVYIPPYSASRIYVTNVNVSNTVIHNTTNLYEVNVSKQRYLNRTVSGAVTAVPEDTFTSGKRVSRSAINVSPREAAVAHVGGMAPPVAPTRRSLAPLPETASPRTRPTEQIIRRPVVVQRVPAPATVPFEKRQRTLENNPGRPLDSRTIEGLRRVQPERPQEYRQVRPSTAESGSPRMPNGEVRRNKSVSDQEKRRREIEQEWNSPNRRGKGND